jgi:hypothetical protein
MRRAVRRRLAELHHEDRRSFPARDAARRWDHWYKNSRVAVEIRGRGGRLSLASIKMLVKHLAGIALLPLAIATRAQSRTTCV